MKIRACKRYVEESNEHLCTNKTPYCANTDTTLLCNAFNHLKHFPEPFA